MWWVSGFLLLFCILGWTHYGQHVHLIREELMKTKAGGVKSPFHLFTLCSTNLYSPQVSTGWANIMSPYKAGGNVIPLRLSSQPTTKDQLWMLIMIFVIILQSKSSFQRLKLWRMDLVFFKRVILIPSTAPHGGVVAIAQVGVCGSGATTTEGSFFIWTSVMNEYVSKTRADMLLRAVHLDPKGFASLRAPLQSMSGMCMCCWGEGGLFN